MYQIVYNGLIKTHKNTNFNLIYSARMNLIRAFEHTFILFIHLCIHAWQSYLMLPRLWFNTRDFSIEVMLPNVV